ncbi:patatin-like phospholipase family protein [Malikia spinosa]|uniref:patatin-like phospholipase family protein n=2 Tax=Malikia spinosa TaxID=86180 RepID=UPI000A5784ED
MTNTESNKSKQSNVDLTKVAIACQGGGSHAAYVAGTLIPLLQQFSGADNKLALVALSGTSGGAITAAVAWWGLLTGGPAHAIQQLCECWNENSALRLGEVLHNRLGISWLNSLPCEMQWDPAGFPLRGLLDLHSTIWPMLATGPLDNWIRPNYFSLKNSLEDQLSNTAGLDFMQTAEAIGQLCSVPARIQEWRARALEEQLNVLPAALGPADELYQTIISDVQQAVAYLDGNHVTLSDKAWLKHAMIEYEKTAKATVDAFKANIPHNIPINYQGGINAMQDLDNKLFSTIALIPRLMLGAVDIGTGEFRVFRSDRVDPNEGISIDAIRASAAIPILFEPVHIGTPNGRQPDHWYWDGLFSQNPPIKTFTAPPGRTSLAQEFKPDEIWIAQVNPKRIQLKEPPGALPTFDVFDRRNELSGNLSLFQEIDFIDAMNRKTDECRHEAETTHKHISVLTIPIDDKAMQANIGSNLGFSSKLDRSRRLKNALIAHGDDQARKFLAVRELFVKYFNQPKQDVRTLYYQKNQNIKTLLNDINDLRKRFPVSFRVFIEEIAIGEHPACNCRNGANWHVTLHWRGAAETNNNDRAQLVGRLHLDLVRLNNNSQNYQPSNGMLNQVRITEWCVQPPPQQQRPNWPTHP